MNVSIVIVLLSIFNLLSCAKLVRHDTRSNRSAMEKLYNENQENEKISQTNSEFDKEEEPYFSKPDTVLPFLAKPSGNMARIRCVGAGNPTPNITWTKDNQEIKRYMGTVQIKKWALILEDLTPKDSGIYVCKLCNIHGCIEHKTNLHVEDRFPGRPYIVEGHPANQTVIVNGNVTFRCQVFGDTAVYITWVKNHALNDTDAQPDTVRLENDEDNSDELTIHNITQKDEGWYTCIAANRLGYTTASAYLHVVDDI